MQYNDLAAADLTPLKDELIDTVSACLIREPRYESVSVTRAASCDLERVPTKSFNGDSATATIDGTEADVKPASVAASSSRKQEKALAGPLPEEDPITRIRALAHAISAHDGEFVLKLALYVRHALGIRRTANFLTALCSREAKCLPFLPYYSGAIVQLPSDWLSVANYAYFFDSDVEHTRLDKAPLPPSASMPAAGLPEKTLSHSKVSQQAKSMDRASSRSPLPLRAARSAHVQPPKMPTVEAPRLPNALRRSLVACFAKFDEFSVAKYNNEGAEKKRRWRDKMRAKRLEADVDEPDSDVESGEDSVHTAPKQRPAKAERKTFTFKQLVRMLHISSPPYTVCCLLGRRYPDSAEAFTSLGLHQGGREFDPTLCGTRMRLPIPETWETRIARDGNTGAVWDDLVSQRKLPFMATLRNLRNLLKHCCSESTHASVLQRLASEDQVAGSRQFPYRFYSAYEVVRSVIGDYKLLMTEKKKRELAPRRRGQPKPKALLTEEEFVIRRRCKFEEPLIRLAVLEDLVERYTNVLDRAVAISTTLNIIPMRGTSIVILHVQDSLEHSISASCGGAVGSLRTKLEVAALLMAMMSRACEDCTIILHHTAADKVINTAELRSESLLDDVRRIVDICKELLVLDNGPAEVACFPYWYLDQVVERRSTVESLVVIDEGHHTYSSMNLGAPSLGDLPVYLARMRRTSCESMIFLGLSISPQPSHRNKRKGTTVRERYSHRNDLLLTGFSDSVLRLVAERLHGGPRSSVERADVTYNVNRASAKRQHFSVDETRRTLRAIRAIEREHRDYAAAALPSVLRDGKGPTGGYHLQSTVSVGFNSEGDGLTASESLSALGGNAKDNERVVSNVAIRLGGGGSGLLGKPQSEDRMSLQRPLELPSLNADGSILSGYPFCDVSARALASTAAGSTFVDSASSLGAEAKAMENSKGRDSSADLEEKDVRRGGSVSVVIPSSGAAGGMTQTFAAAAALARASPSCRLLSSYRECRFFISSTFLDMNNERNALVLDVFPRLRRWASESGLKVTLLEVDLRWGITEAATAENLSTSVCLNEVTRCAPFFIGMLGARYGFCPSPLQVVPSDDVCPDDYEWMRDLPASMDGHVSVTELEMRHGICTARRRLRADQPPSVVFFRREYTPLIQSLPTDEQRAVYQSDAPTSAERIARLEQFIESESGVPIIDYKATFMADSTAARPSAAEVAFPSAEEGGLGSWGVRRADRATVGPLAADGTLTLPSVSSMQTSKLVRPPFAAKTLTSQDVLIDMKDFSTKAFFSLKAIVCNVCGVPFMPSIPAPAIPTALVTTVATTKAASAARNSEPQSETETLCDSRRAMGTAGPDGEMLKEAGPTQFYSTYYRDMRNFMTDLLKTYVAPHGFIEDLAAFALTGVMGGMDQDRNESSRDHGDGSTESRDATRLFDDRARAENRSDNGGEAWRLTATGAGAAQARELELDVIAATTNVLVLEGEDGDGKSSALAALTHHLFEYAQDSVRVVYYATQASDGTLRSLVLFLALTLVYRVDLDDEFVFSESDTASNLLQILPRIYDVIKKQQVPVIVLLDGLDGSLEREEIQRNLGRLVSSAAAPEVRFILSATPCSAITNALMTRVPPARVVSIPELDVAERAELIRRHLAAYGKQLQETLEINEIRCLLGKREACHAAYITASLTWLRLFSTFHTLRSDIANLPGTISQVYSSFFMALERLFDRTTCRLVLTTLYISQATGGVMEYNLYRLVSNVAVASRVVALLSGTCLRVSRGRITLSSSSFEASIASTYLPHASDRVAAYENLLTAELLYRPLGPALDSSENRSALRTVVDSIRCSAQDPAYKCVFKPNRYSSRELFGLLLSSLHANRHDVLISLATYLPFVENLLTGPSSLLQRFISFLLHASTVGKLNESKLMPIAQFLQRHYHQLLLRPELIYQCVRNSPSSFTALSKFISADMTRAIAERTRQEQIPHLADSSGVAADADDLDAPKIPDEVTRVADLDKIMMLAGAGSVGSHVFTEADGMLRLSETALTRPHMSGPMHGDVCQGSVVAPAGVGASTGGPTKHCANYWVRWANISHHGSEDRISTFSPSSHAILCMAISGSNRYVALGCSDFMARVSPLESPEQATSHLRHSAAVTAVAFVSLRDDVLVTGCERGVLYVWSLRDNSLLQVATSHRRRITAIACHPTEPLICTGGHDTYTILWDLLGTTSNLSVLRAEHKEHVKKSRPWQRLLSHAGVDIGSDAPSLKRGAGERAGGGGTKHKQCDGVSGVLKPAEILRHHSSPVSTVAFHSSGTIIATGSWDGKLYFTDLGHYREPSSVVGSRPATRELPPIEEAASLLAMPYVHQCVTVGPPIRVAVFMPSLMVTCVVGMYDGAVALVDYVSGAVLATLRGLHSSPLTSISCSPDGKLLATADELGVLRLSYAGVTGTPLCTLNGHRGAISAVQFLSDDSFVLWSSGVDKSVQTWSIHADEPPALPTSHSTTVTCLAVATDNSLLVTGCADGAAFVFSHHESDVGRLGGQPTASEEALQPHFTLAHDGSRVSAIAFGLDNTRIIVGVAYGHVYVWSSEPGFSRNEGRLLLCVRALTHRMYPVVAIESSSMVPEDRHKSVKDSPLGKQDGEHLHGTEVDEREGGASTLADMAHVTALCSNGETVALDIYSDAVSMTMVAYYDDMAVPDDDLADDRDEAALTTITGHLHNISSGSSSHRGSNSDGSASRDSGRGEWCGKGDRRDETPSSQRPHRAGANPDVSVADEQGQCSDKRGEEQQRAKEAHHHVQRKRLRWVAPLSHSQMSSPTPNTLDGRIETRANSEESMEIGGMDECVEPENALGEEIIASKPLLFSCGEAPPQSRMRPGYSGGVGQWTGGGASHRFGTRKLQPQQLRVNEHFSLLIGLKRFHLASHCDNCVAALRVRTDVSYNSAGDGFFHTDFTLAEAEVFVCSSSHVALSPPDGGSGHSTSLTSGMDGLIAVATSEGNVLIFQIQCGAQACRGGDGEGAANQSGDCDSRLYDMIERTTVTLWHQLRVHELRPEGTETVLVDSLDLMVYPTKVATVVEAGGSHFSSFATVQLVLGCRDGTTRLLSTHWHPYHSPTPLTVPTSSTAVAGILSPMSTQALCHPPVTQPQVGSTTVYGQYSASPAHSAFTETCIFFSSAPLTALAILHPVQGTFPDTTDKAGRGHTTHSNLLSGTQSNIETPLAGKAARAAGTRAPQWVTGDSLGNLYQLYAEDEAFGSGLHQTLQSRQNRQMGGESDHARLMGMLAAGGTSGLSGWAWNSWNSIDWLKRVEITNTAVLSSAGTHGGRSLPSAQGLLGGMATEWREHSTFREFVDATAKLHPFTTSLTDYFRTPPAQAAGGEMAYEGGYVHLPSLGTISNAAAEKSTSHAGSHLTPHQTEVAAPSALGKRHPGLSLRESTAAPLVVTSPIVPLATPKATTPLSLAEEERRIAKLFVAPSLSSIPALQDHALPAQEAATTLLTSSVAATALHATRVLPPKRGAEAAASEQGVNCAEGSAYFSVLYEAAPPPGLTSACKGEWFHHQHSVAKEAARVQGYNQSARHALQAYTSRALMSVGDKFLNMHS